MEPKVPSPCDPSLLRDSPSRSNVGKILREVLEAAVAENRGMLVAIGALTFVTGVAVGVAATLLVQRNPVPPAGASQQQTTAATSQTAGSALTSQTSQANTVFINQKPVEEAKLDELKRLYGAAPPPGRYWYDPRSGLYGIWGYEAAGYIRPGHDFGPLPEDASRGNTGVYINGRHINLTEAQFFQRIFGAVYQGRWWLDGQTGNVGLEGNPMPMANLVVAMQQASRAGGGGGSGGGGYRWRDNINNSSGGAENGCVWVNSPGSTYSSSGCN